MPELRKDPITGRLVVLAEDRGGRPQEFDSGPLRRSDAVCPFCEGNESMTPREVLVFPQRGSAPTGHRWRVRVVPNKYPALVPDAPATAALAAARADGRTLGIADPALGAHEVIVESPEHVTRMSDLPADHWTDMLLAYVQRLNHWKARGGLRLGMPFKNVGAGAGASLEHVHSQLVVLPGVPPTVQQELDGAHAYFIAQQRCVYCAVAAEEESAEVRLVLQSAQFVAFCPYASRFAYETWIMPRQHLGHFEALSEGQCVELGDLLRQVIVRLEIALPEPAYNYVVRTTPFDMPDPEYYHWHIEIMPRVARLAGFELGTGLFINTVAPEAAASTLRQL